jgi:nucleotide-binding universal stress UspA family protein
MLKMLIAVDGSEGGRRAIEAAGRLAAEVALEAVLLNVREGPGYHGDLPPYDDEAVSRVQRERQETVLAAALEQARTCGLTRAGTTGVLGMPAQEIVRVAGERGADMIVMGTRGMTALGGLLLGSVAQRVVHLAHVPVMLVK